VDDGIEAATHFLALLTPNSLRSEWVQTELDAGMIKKIEGTCRLIPVLAGVTIDDLPPTLRAIMVVHLDPYEAGLRELLAACHGTSAKPPLGAPPRWAVERPLAGMQLSVHAQRLAAFLNARSEYALGRLAAGDPTLTYIDVMGATGMTEDEAAEAVDELKTAQWVTVLKASNTGRAGFTHVAPTPLLFIETDPILVGRNPREDAKALAAAMVNSGKDMVFLELADQVLGWGPRRINPAAHCLALAEPEAAVGTAAGTWAYYGFHVTGRIRRLAKEA